LRFAPSLLLNDEDMAEGLRRLEHALTEFAATSDNP
jgi:acetylornithine aminotransferase apoenzyme (EC 2.6.1.11)